jgi:hypothetical protein
MLSLVSIRGPVAGEREEEGREAPLQAIAPHSVNGSSPPAHRLFLAGLLYAARTGNTAAGDRTSHFCRCCTHLVTTSYQVDRHTLVHVTGRAHALGRSDLAPPLSILDGGVGTFGRE